MNLSKTSTLSTSYPPRFTLIKSMACGLALLASGQAFAAGTVYYSLGNITAADLTNGPSWSAAGSTMCGASQGSGGISPDQTDIMAMCNSNSLTLDTGTTFSAGELVFLHTSSFSGGLKLSAGSKTIANRTSSILTIPTLDFSLMNVSETISITSSTGNGMKFTTPSGGSGKRLECPSGAIYSGGSTIAPGITCTIVTVPLAPTSLSATAASPTQIDLSWTDASSDETGFKIFRNGTELTPSPKVGVGTTTFSDTGLTCNTAYTFTVKATNANGDSAAAATTPASTTTSACISAAISAPIFSTKEKPAVFSEEVK